MELYADANYKVKKLRMDKNNVRDFAFELTSNRSREPCSAARQHQKMYTTRAAQWNLVRAPLVLVVLDMTACWLVANHSETPPPPPKYGKGNGTQKSPVSFNHVEKWSKAQLRHGHGLPQPRRRLTSCNVDPGAAAATRRNEMRHGGAIQTLCSCPPSSRGHIVH